MDKTLLEALVNKEMSYAQIANECKLGRTTVRYWMNKFGLKSKTSKLKAIKYDKVRLTKLVAEANSLADVTRTLEAGHVHTRAETIKKYIKIHKIDTSHFHTKAIPSANKTTLPLEMVLVENSTYSRGSLKQRLIKEKILPLKCGICDLPPIWKTKKLVLVIDHINGISDDNRLTNLRLVCPNCDSQLVTFAGRNKKDDILINIACTMCNKAMQVKKKQNIRHPRYTCSPACQGLKRRLLNKEKAAAQSSPI